MAIGASKKEYTKDAYGNLTIKRPDGTSSVVKTTDAAYQSTVKAMHADGAKNIGVAGSTQQPAVKSPMQNLSGMNSNLSANYANQNAMLLQQLQQQNAGLSGKYDSYMKAVELAGNKQFNNPYADQMKEIIDKITNRQPFSYDHNTDPSYKAYATQYGQLGDQAMQDTLGDVASMTGGQASSYAVTAAQQAKNRWNSELTNVIPQLMQAAYARYQGDASMDYQTAGTLNDYTNSAYNQFSNDRDSQMNAYQYLGSNVYNQIRDNVGDAQWQQGFNQNQYNADRNYNFDSARAETQDNQYKQEFDYQVSRDKVLDSQWMKQFTASEQQRMIENALSSRQISVSEGNLAMRRSESARSAAKEKEIDPYAKNTIMSIVDAAYAASKQYQGKVDPVNWIKVNKNITESQRQAALKIMLANEDEEEEDDFF